MENLKYLIALNHFPKFGVAAIRKIKKYFPDTKTAFHASAREFEKCGIDGNIALEFSEARNKINSDQILEKLTREKIQVIDIDNENYPKILKEIYNPPPLIYYKGDINISDQFSIGVVGSRNHTDYGKQAAQNIVRELVQNNLTIVSGMALGIDTIAHLATLENNGKTIAVLGTGLDSQSIYPSSNRYLVDRIILAGGAVISEFPLGTPPLRYNFPQRNRIISGLSLGTLVIEARKKSGALITANLALEQNRDVFALPGSIYSPLSAGPNDLIKKGAKLITGAKDIIEELNLRDAISYIDNKKIIPDTKEEEKILHFLSHEPQHIDTLVRLSQLDTATVNSTLTIMEMKGMIRNLGNMQYVLAR